MLPCEQNTQCQAVVTTYPIQKTKCSITIPFFRLKNYTLWGRTYLYSPGAPSPWWAPEVSPYKRVPSPPDRRLIHGYIYPPKGIPYKYGWPTVIEACRIKWYGMQTEAIRGGTSMHCLIKKLTDKLSKETKNLQHNYNIAKNSIQ